MSTVATIGIILLVLIVIAAIRNPPSKRQVPIEAPAQAPPAAPPPPSVNVGDEAILDPGPGAGAWIALDNDAWNAMLDAQNAKDGEGLMELLRAGRAIREPNGARVKVLERSFASTRVRVIDGVNPGKAGWIQYEYVKPAR